MLREKGNGGECSVDNGYYGGARRTPMGFVRKEVLVVDLVGFDASRDALG
jgi:hypothetical protein